MSKPKEYLKQSKHKKKKKEAEVRENILEQSETAEEMTRRPWKPQMTTRVVRALSRLQS